MLHEAAGELVGDPPAGLAQHAGRLQVGVSRGLVVTLEHEETVITVLEIFDFLTERLALRDGIRERRTVLALDPFEQRQPLLDLLETLRRGFDAVGIPSQKRTPGPRAAI